MHVSVTHAWSSASTYTKLGAKSWEKRFDKLMKDVYLRFRDQFIARAHATSQGSSSSAKIVSCSNGAYPQEEGSSGGVGNKKNRTRHDDEDDSSMQQSHAGQLASRLGDSLCQTSFDDLVVCKAWDEKTVYHCKAGLNAIAWRGGYSRSAAARIGQQFTDVR